MAIIDVIRGNLVLAWEHWGTCAESEDLALALATSSLQESSNYDSPDVGAYYETQ